MKTKGFFAKILSRHSSHNVFRMSIGKFPVRSVIRLGSTTVLPDDNTRIQINTPQAIKNSSSKLLMKQCFQGAGVKTASYYSYRTLLQNINSIKFPIIAKSHYGSRNMGNTKLDTIEQLEQWLIGKNIDNYLFEAYFNGSREYRFHVSTEGVFLTWRKLRRNDTPQEQRWFFNNQTCNWVSEQHELYNRPETYDLICQECLKALNSVSLDVGACDVRVNKEGDFIIVEINSAASISPMTEVAYKVELTKLINKKINNRCVGSQVTV